MNPLRTIWIKPKQTFQNFILSNEDQSFISIPIILLGLSFGIDMAGDMPGARWNNLLIGIGLGIAMTFLVMSLIIPSLIKLFGRIWNGPATMRQLVNVSSLSYLPYCLILIHQVVLLLLGENGTTEQVNQGILYVLIIWSFSLLIIGVSTVQRFTYGMALLNILISQLPFFIIGLLRT